MDEYTHILMNAIYFPSYNYAICQISFISKVFYVSLRSNWYKRATDRSSGTVGIHKDDIMADYLLVMSAPPSDAVYQHHDDDHHYY